MIGGLLLVFLGIAGVMQAPFWAVPVVAVLIAVLCGGVPFLRGRVKGPLSWALVAALSALVYAVGYGAGLVLIG